MIAEEYSGEQFGSRWGLVLATLGMAVGTGNIWRFPRIVASNGGGSFLIAWVVFLLLWSIPLMIAEFSFGKRARQGTVRAFGKMAGEGWAWMGGWVALTATAIMFYYPEPSAASRSSSRRNGTGSPTSGSGSTP